MTSTEAELLRLQEAYRKENDVFKAAVLRSQYQRLHRQWMESKR
jgi:hypothetical protein